MPESSSIRSEIFKRLENKDLPFREFMETVLYAPETGYYSRRESPVGRGGDYITAPGLSPVFAFALARLVREVVSRCEGGVFSFVDVGCGDGTLVCAAAEQLAGMPIDFFGVDRNLNRAEAEKTDAVRFFTRLDQLPPADCRLLFSNELFDAFPFARLVRRSEGLYELWVTLSGGALEWAERPAPPEYAEYFRSRGIELAEGQFADVSLEWERFYARMVEAVPRGLIVTIDYGYPEQKLFSSRIRRFGTAAAYAGHRVHRDLLANPGEQDLTAHVNFTDLERVGGRAGAQTLYFDRLARFLLSLGVTEHELFRPVQDVGITSVGEGMTLIQAREEARRLILPDGIGDEMRVLVAGKGVPLADWSFQRQLF